MSILDFEDRNVRLGWIVFGIVIILLVGLVSSYFVFFYTKSCSDKQCYSDALLKCQRMTWIREDDRAAWLYKLSGSSDSDSCNIDVTLLKLKQGTIDIESLQGKKMTCLTFRSDSDFPEKNIESCTGPLKEEIQDILIQRMHNYLLENVGEIKDGFLENLTG